MSLRVYRRVEMWGGERVAECRAVCVYDGDGFLAAGDGGRRMVRVWGIDAPEYGQPCFEESRAALRGLVRGGVLRCEVVCVDRYGRRVCRVRTSGGVDVGLAMVRMGWAWWYWTFARGDVALRGAMAAARRSRAGLWAEEGAVAPWVWRGAAVRMRS